MTHQIKEIKGPVRRKKEELISLFLSLDPKEREKEFRPVNEVAESLGLNPRTIRSWISYGKITAIRLGEKKQFVYMPLLTEFFLDRQDYDFVEEEEF